MFVALGIEFARTECNTDASFYCFVFLSSSRSETEDLISLCILK